MARTAAPACTAGRVYLPPLQPVLVAELWVQEGLTNLAELSSISLEIGRLTVLASDASYAPPLSGHCVRGTR